MAQITTYEDVVPISRVLNYLRFDGNNAPIYEEVEIMRDSACRVVEQYANYYLKPTNKAYTTLNGSVDVYASPINSVVTPQDENNYNVHRKGLYSTYCFSGLSDINDGAFILNVGYTDTEQVDPILIQAVLETVRVWFYNSEGESESLRLLPVTAKSMLKPIKRFVF